MALPEMMGILRQEKWVPEKHRAQVEELCEHMQSADIYDLQEDYVALFDRTPSLSLYLFEHIHGDSRDRGQALVDLDNIYREAGLHNNSEHTPDYLPLFLEYLATLPIEQAKENLQGPVDVLAALAARLKQRGSKYACIFEALPLLGGREPDHDAVRKALEMADGRMPGQKEMDMVWEEQFALQALPEGAESGCPKARDILARMETVKETRQ